MEEISTEAREQRVRRLLAKHGMQLNKAHPRSFERRNYGIGYMVVENNGVILGCEQRTYSATLVDVEEFCSSLDG